MRQPIAAPCFFRQVFEAIDVKCTRGRIVVTERYSQSWVECWVRPLYQPDKRLSAPLILEGLVLETGFAGRVRNRDAIRTEGVRTKQIRRWGTPEEGK